MPDQVASTIVAQDYPISLPQVGGFTGAVLAAAMGFSYIWSKLKRDNSENNAGTGLYNNLSDQVEKLVARINALENDRDKWQKEATDLRIEVGRLKSLEEANERLSMKLEEKDVQLNKLIEELVAKNNLVQEMQERLHTLEIQQVKSTISCDTCSYKIGVV